MNVKIPLSTMTSDQVRKQARHNIAQSGFDKRMENAMKHPTHSLIKKLRDTEPSEADEELLTAAANMIEMWNMVAGRLDFQLRNCGVSTEAIEKALADFDYYTRGDND